MHQLWLMATQNIMQLVLPILSHPEVPSAPAVRFAALRRPGEEAREVRFRLIFPQRLDSLSSFSGRCNLSQGGEQLHDAVLPEKQQARGERRKYERTEGFLYLLHFANNDRIPIVLILHVQQLCAARRQIERAHPLGLKGGDLLRLSAGQRLTPDVRDQS